MRALVEVRGGVAEAVVGDVLIVDWDNIGEDEITALWVLENLHGLPAPEQERIRGMIAMIWGGTDG